MIEESAINKDGSSHVEENEKLIQSNESEPAIAGPYSLDTVSSNAYLTLQHVDSSRSSPCVDSTSKQVTNSSTLKLLVGVETGNNVLSDAVDRVDDTNMKSSSGHALDLNVADTSGVLEHNPFYPYKNLGHLKPSDPSECGSTTGPPEESEALRRWKEMKHNNFLSYSYGGIPPAPKRRARPLKRKKEDKCRKKETTANRGQVNGLTRIASPSGLLGGLNPGIINHVRNRKQVHSIIKAMVGPEEPMLQGHGEAQTINTGMETKTEKFNLPSSRQFSFSVPECTGEADKCDSIEALFCRGPASSRLNLKTDDNLALKLFTAGTVSSGNSGTTSCGDVSVSQENDVLSIKAASVASKWLKLLCDDIRGRLGALGRSRRRVRYAIQKELPYLLSAHASSNQENESSLQLSTGVSSNFVAPTDHMKRWEVLFNQMDMALSKEGKHLEILLEQMKGMQMNCERGLNSVVDKSLPFLSSSESSLGTRVKDGEILDGEYAVRAAAASLYSTCNVMMATDNLSCFCP